MPGSSSASMTISLPGYSNCRIASIIIGCRVGVALGVLLGVVEGSGVSDGTAVSLGAVVAAAAMVSVAAGTASTPATAKVVAVTGRGVLRGGALAQAARHT